MTEADRNPAIRIHIDQQVFIDAVVGHEEVEDATVVTEVVGFDRNDTHYVLDGALVFTGYIRQVDEEELEITAEDLQGDIGSAVSEEEITVQQIHCRMPFILEVPVEAQRTEFLNVMARVGTWNIATLGPKWLHVRAELIVNGLTGEDGYRFRCGTQEEGISSNQFADSLPHRSASEFSQEAHDVQEAHDFQQPSSPYESIQSQFPFASSWQNEYLTQQAPLEGAYPFQAPYTTPFVTPSQPINWERKWPEPLGSSTRQETQEEVREQLQDDHPGYAAEQVQEDSADHTQTEAANSASLADHDAESVFLSSTRSDHENTYEAEFEQQTYDSSDREEFVEIQSERDELVVAEENVTVDAGTVVEHAGQSESEQEEAVYHFEDIAESSALHQEPVFQLKIQGKNVQESSTFGAMSTLMEAAQSTRDESGSVSSPSLVVPSNLAEASSKLETKQKEESVSAIRESSTYAVEEAHSNTPQPDSVTLSAEPAAAPESLEMDLESPILVASEVVQNHVVAPVDIVKERPVELVQELALETVDVKGTEEPVAASVTIAERKQLQPESDHVYLWTELYPFLEETFQPVKYRIVQEDDTVDRIAENYRIQAADLMRANHMQTEQIEVGQMLYIPVRKR